MFGRKDLYALSLMFFFWTLFDGIISYTTPLFILQNGFSNTQMGIVLASSSVGGAIFDFILARFIKNTNFRRLFLAMFVVSFIYPFVLFSSKLLFFYIIAMALWGIYYDLGNFGEYDFIGRRFEIARHADGFGIISVFTTLGYMIAPLIASLLIVGAITFQLFLFAFIFLIISFFIYFVFLKLSKKKVNIHQEIKHKNFTFWKEIKLWPIVAREIWQILIFICILNIFDAFFWTIGPMFSQTLKNISPLGSLFLTVYSLPTVIIGFFAGKITVKYGKKKTAMAAFIFGAIVLVALNFLNNLILILVVIFVSSLFSAIAWPAIKGSVADYVYESDEFEGHIEGLVDFSTNAGYIIGPILAGVAADKLGDKISFSIMGIILSVMVLVLLKFTPRKIRVDGKV